MDNKLEVLYQEVLYQDGTSLVHINDETYKAMVDIINDVISLSEDDLQKFMWSLSLIHI